METAQNRTSIPDEAPQRARARATYASFGNDGTTATANAHGHLLQITRYFGNKPSGFFCADLPSAPEPYYVESRMDYLQQSCQDASRGMRLLFDGEDGKEWRAQTNIDALPKLSFLQDRWPTFTTESPSFDLDIQYLISQNTVYQKYTFKLKEKPPNPPKIPILAINANLLLRNLNFIEYDEENEREGYDEHYAHHLLNDGHSIATVHRVAQTKPGDEDAIGLFMSIFINGQLQKLNVAEHPEKYKDLDDLEDFEDLEDCKYYDVTPDQQIIVDLLERKSLEVTVVYRIDLVSSATLMDMPPIFSHESLVGAEQIINSSFTTISFSEEPYLNFIIRRNLEHILSVCCIPTSDSANCNAVALTCGDISGHRIATKANFYAFQLLLTALKHFKKNGLSCSCPAGSSSCEDYACKLNFRIRVTCRGHLRWLSNAHTAHMKTDIDTLDTGYWATGELISGGANNPEMPITNMLVDFIKAASFCQIIEDEQIQKGVTEDFKDTISFLIEYLHLRNKNNQYIFPRFKKQTPHKFYISDQALIWWAIKSAEQLGLASSCYIPQDFGQQEMSYSSSKIRKSMLMKMAAESPEAKKSMLATSRSLLEDKFSLQVNDTILFHTMKVGLFDKENSVEDESDIWKNKIDTWKNIVDCQEDQDTALSDPLQVALVFILSTNNICIDSRPAAEVHDFTKSVLLASSSSNGLLPGQLNEYQEPILFDNESSRDTYWHVTFEVPYILWNYQKRRQAENYQLTIEHMADPRLSKIVHGMETIIGRIDAITTSPTVTALKKNVNEIPDEWLYDEPNFFKFHERVSSDSIAQFCDENEYNHYGMVIDDAILNVQGQDGHKSDVAGYIIDVPRNKGLYAKTRTFELHNVIKNDNLDQCFKDSRTPAISKKRFLHFHPLSQYAALACFLASSERDAIASFFDRHASYDGYFSETTTLALNKWATELHLSFYQISDQEPSPGNYHTIAKMVGTPFMRSNGIEETTIWINRATMGFRFDGDIFDRYWTCHFIEHSPRIISEKQTNRYKGDQNPRSILTREIEGALKESSWRQRKILELILFDLMLEEILKSTKEILKEARLRIERSFKPETITSFNHKASGSVIMDPLDLIDKVDNSMFLSTNSLWNELEPIFQLMKDALHENLEIIARWADREKTHGRDEPQWTLHDESSYRRAISALQNSNRQRIHELKRCDAEITSFNVLFARKLEVMRSELDRRGADDIRLFTYVTVVFLPVGFATSVFSMSESPSRDTLHRMIILAILAFLITLIALVNARILDKVLGPIFGACRTGTEAIINPLISALNGFIQPVSKTIYLMLCRSVYGIAFPLYMQFLSPEDLRKNDQVLETNDKQTEKHGPGMENNDRNLRKTGQDEKQKHFKQITELGPIRTARRNIVNMRAEKKAKEQQEMRDVEREVKRQMEDRFKEEEEGNFKENEQAELNETILKDMTELLEKELKDAIEADFETELATMKRYRGEMSVKEKEKLKGRLRNALAPPMKERFLNEGKRRIRRQTNIIIKDRVRKRIEKEVKERMERKRAENEERNTEEERNREARETRKSSGGIVRRIIGKASQSALVKSAERVAEEGTSLGAGYTANDSMV